MTLAAKLDDLGNPAWIALTVVSFLSLVAARPHRSGVSGRKRANGTLDRLWSPAVAAASPGQSRRMVGHAVKLQRQPRL